jgi:hypothetical protein
LLSNSRAICANARYCIGRDQAVADQRRRIALADHDRAGASLRQRGAILGIGEKADAARLAGTRACRRR